MKHSGFAIERLPEFNEHALVSFFHDAHTGLRGFVAIHNTNLGPATGGTRMWHYASETEALRDALNLSRAMTYKCALAGVPYGGGKGVIIADPDKDKTPDLLRSYAGLLHSFLRDRFRTGTDVGLTDDDVKLMSKENPFMVGVLRSGKFSLSQMASLGAFYSIQGCFEEVYMKTSLRGKRFAIKGLGKTGMELLRLLHEEGAHVIAAEIVPERIAFAKRHFPGVTFVSPRRIHAQDVDVYCPCALGGDLHPRAVKELQCRFVVGTANNQLASPDMGLALHRRGIVYAPDYVANAGGLINVVDELEKGGYKKTRVLSRIKNVKRTIRTIVSRSQKEKQPTSVIADRMAEEIFLKTKRSN